MPRIRGCSITIVRIIVLPCGAIIGALSGALLTLLTSTAIGTETNPILLLSPGIGVGLLAWLLLLPWRRGWSIGSLLPFVLGGGLLAIAAGWFGASNGAATVLIAGLCGIVVFGTHRPHETVRLALTLSLVIGGAMAGWELTGWGPIVTGALGGLAIAIINPQAVANLVGNALNN